MRLTRWMGDILRSKGRVRALTTALNNGSSLQQGRYQIGAVLGEGGFGITYQATDNRLGRTVAVKELFILGCSREGNAVRPPLTYAPQSWDKAIQNFLIEARIIAGLDHPGIVTVYDQFEENNTAYMVMKFIIGTTLSRLMAQQGGSLSEDEAREYTIQVGQALAVVHAHNLLHRDIKPSNIILQPNGQTVLIDFGAAREFALDRSVAVTAIASSGFSPPEQFYAKGRKGPYTDVFSLAATCYYMLTGVAPTHELEEPPTTSLLPALNHALAFNPQDRPQTVADFLDELVGRKPAPPLDAVNSVIQSGSGDPISDSYVRGMYETLTPPVPADKPQSTILTPGYVRAAPGNVGGAPTVGVNSNFPPLAAAPIAATPTLGMNDVPPPVAPPFKPTPVTAPRHHNLLPMLIGGPAAIALLLVLAFLLLGKNEPIRSQDVALAQMHATQTAFAGIDFGPSPTTLPSQPPLPSNTPLLVAQLTPTAPLVVAAAAPPQATESATSHLPTATDTPLPSATPLPPTNTPLPTRATLRPRPTSTLRPPTHTPVPPTSTPLPTNTPPPTSTSLPPPPNPTSNPSSALGAGWSQLGPADFTTHYCNLQQTGSLARLTKRTAVATALDWACYSADVQKVSGINMAEACRAQYGANASANVKNPNDANSWVCYRGTVELGPAPIDEYCAATQLYGSAQLENRNDVPPAYRWACFAPQQLGPVNVNTACANQYGPGALGYWLTLDDPRWSCWRRQ